MHKQLIKQVLFTRITRAPLKTTLSIQLPIGAIHPEGWLKEQLVRMKNGMTRDLDKRYPLVIGKRNGWLGGDRDQWERDLTGFMD